RMLVLRCCRSMAVGGPWAAVKIARVAVTAGAAAMLLSREPTRSSAEVGGFVGGDPVLVLQCLGDVVQAMQQAMAAMRFDVKRSLESQRIGDRLLLQVDRQLIGRMLR